MGIIPTGEIICGPANKQLRLTRTFNLPIQTVWNGLTESTLTEQWIGHWSGEAGTGKQVMFTMSAEEGASAAPVDIIACDPPGYLELAMAVTADVTWNVSIELRESAAGTVMVFVQELTPGTDPADIGPGWEYYADRLAASLSGHPMPDWDEYYPAQRTYYIAANESRDCLA